MAVKVSLMYTGSDGRDVPIIDTTDPDAVRMVATAGLEEYRRLSEQMADPVIAEVVASEADQAERLLHALGLASPFDVLGMRAWRLATAQTN